MPHFAVKFPSGKEGHITATGQRLGWRYDEVNSFSEGRAWCRNGDVVYLINSSGSILIEEKVDLETSYLGQRFYHGVSWWKVNGRYRMVDRSGEIILEIDALGAHSMGEGVSFAVYSPGRSALYDVRGNILATNAVPTGLGVQEGVFPSRSDEGLVGYVNVLGDYVIPPIYKQGGQFNEGLASVFDGENEFYINRAGVPVLVPKIEFDYIGSFHEGIAEASLNGLWGWIGRNGQWIVEPCFDYVGDIGEGMVCVEKGELWGYASLDGDMIIPFQFDRVTPFENGVAVVQLEDEDKDSVIRADGSFVPIGDVTAVYR